jgi:hypothetical protein
MNDELHKHDAVAKERSLGEFNTKDSINLGVLIYFNQKTKRTFDVPIQT